MGHVGLVEFDDPSYSMIPANWWYPAIWWSPAIQWSIGSINFDNPTVYGYTFISDGLVLDSRHSGLSCQQPKLFKTKSHIESSKSIVISLIFHSLSYKFERKWSSSATNSHPVLCSSYQKLDVKGELAKKENSRRRKWPDFNGLSAIWTK